ncbi:MAG: glycine dehydrogenase, partial [Allopontixanthobacter sediminis]
TNSGLCALAFSVHMTLLGEKGLRALAAENHRLACIAADTLSALPGVRLLREAFCNEVTLLLDGDARQIVRDLAAENVLAGVSLGRLYPDHPELAGGLLVAVTETTTEEDIHALAAALKEKLA